MDGSSPLTSTQSPLAGASGIQSIIGGLQKSDQGMQQAAEDTGKELTSIQAKTDALVPPQAPQISAPPQPQYRSPIQGFGSIAGLMAAIGGLMTRRPLVTSLNAATGVINAYLQQDQAAADRAFEEWKTNADYALKLQDFKLNAYRAALESADSDRASALAKFNARASAFQDDTARHVAEINGIEGAQSILRENERLHVDLGKYTQEATEWNEKFKLWKEVTATQGYQDATPSQKLDIYRDTWGSAGTDALKQMEVSFIKSTTASLVSQGASPADATAKATQLWKTATKPDNTGQLGSRAEVYLKRMLTSAEEGVPALRNIMELPITSSVGMMGLYRSEGSIMDATKQVTLNELSSQEVQDYNTMVAGLTRNLSQIEANGLAPSGQLTHQMDAVIIKPGDTNLTKLRRMAEIRQIIEKGLEPNLYDPKVPPPQKEEITRITNDIKEAVPFTQHDITQLEYSKDPKKTLRDFAKESSLAPDAESDSPSMRPSGVPDDAQYSPSQKAWWWKGQDGAWQHSQPSPQ